ncbi:MAG: YciI family protein [Proteobacteria bacterium]|nr:YciI family protein [Pseudomonadota bacterium]
MFIVLLKFSENKAQAPDFMAGHNEWIKRGFDTGLFLMVGSLQPQIGGGILTHNASRAEVEAFVSEDPFVQENVVSPEIMEFSPAKAEDRLAFLMA